MSFSDAGDVILTSSSQNKEVHVGYSTPSTKDPLEGKTTAVIAVMRGKPKGGCQRHCSNKHYMQKLVRVLLDCGSDGNLVFVNKDKPIMLPYSKKQIPQSWITLNGIFQTKCKTRIELNFFEHSDSIKFSSKPDVLEYNKGSRPQYDLIFGTETMKELGIILHLKPKTIIIDEVILPMRNINHLHGATTLRALKLNNNSLAMKPQSTQDGTKHAMQILNAKYKKADLHSTIKENCKHVSANQQ
jgi:hypothetical protein